MNKVEVAYYVDADAPTEGHAHSHPYDMMIKPAPGVVVDVVGLSVVWRGFYVNAPPGSGEEGTPLGPFGSRAAAEQAYGRAVEELAAERASVARMDAQVDSDLAEDGKGEG